ncbi:4Fe-4S dicluster domain-containing protein [Thermosediminibacter litoriperuensis]|uniref:2-oxoglutarate ferredoxin oxidoreductase subunit delta n=1 Tax=Thermosediminibacter litoriperuensis TaxID=291989 RepID=A0A5S5B1P7_9FIRM|nr:4Fe-4S dicluster domain-containing protein [Thermosediminibacter litoriperuensis]TYP59860.1 2-oxoglutarate ferredoxin oxidoreductase subunit delta [Thermosediminibacter litoriperuensis]
MKKKFQISVVGKRCKKCGICVAFCPKKVLKMEINSVPVAERLEECIGCNWCYLRCPEIAIFVKEKEVV